MLEEHPQLISMAWLAGGRGQGDINHAIQRHLDEHLVHEVIIANHSAIEAGRIVDWIRRHSRGECHVTLIGSDSGPLVARFSSAAEATHFKLAFS